GDRLPDAAGASGDQGGAAGERAGVVLGAYEGAVGHRAGDLYHLSADVGGLGREQEPQGGGGVSGGGAGRETHQLRGAPAAGLLAQRADEALQPLLRRRLVVVVRIGGGAEHDDAAVAGQGAHHRVQRP